VIDAAEDVARREDEEGVVRMREGCISKCILEPVLDFLLSAGFLEVERCGRSVLGRREETFTMGMGGICSFCSLSCLGLLRLLRLVRLFVSNLGSSFFRVSALL